MNNTSRGKPKINNIQQRPANVDANNPIIKYALDCHRIINQVFREYDAGALVGDPWRGDSMQIAASSHVSFKPILHTGTTEKHVISKAHDMIMSRLTNYLGKQVFVRAQQNALCFEVPIPKSIRKPLLLELDNLKSLTPNTLLLGRHYRNGRNPAEQSVNLCDPNTAHILTVGMTGSGKSVLMQTMMASLAWATSPQRLRYFIIDLKNEDLMPFQSLPHCDAFAGDVDEAAKIINFIHDEKERRRSDPRRRLPRIVLWVDEIGQIAEDKESIEKLNNVIMVARSFGINIIAATQRATERGGIGRMMNANFGVRNVGLVSDATEASIATGRPQTDAHRLPGSGSFLKVQGNQILRFQSYWLGNSSPDASTSDDGDAIRALCSKWGKVDISGGYGQLLASYDSQSYPDIASYSQSFTREKMNQEFISDQRIEFPIGEGRPLTNNETKAVQELADSGAFDYRGKPSINRAMMHVYGSRSPERAQWIKEILGD